MEWKIYKEYNDQLIASIEVPFYDVYENSTLLTAPDGWGVQVIKPPSTVIGSYKYIGQFGSGYMDDNTFIQRDGYQHLETNFISQCFTSSLRLPEPDDIKDNSKEKPTRYLYFEKGSRIQYQYYRYKYINGVEQNQETCTLRFQTMGVRYTTTDSEGHEQEAWATTTTPSDGMGTFSFNWDTHKTLYIALAKAQVRWRNYDGWDAAVPAIIFMGKMMSVTGSWTDAFNLGVIAETFFNLSDGTPAEPNKKTKKNAFRGGGASGAYSNTVNGERMNVTARNAIFSYCSTDGNGLTCYRLNSPTYLNSILRQCYSLGEWKDNSYIRQALISAFLLPNVPVLHTYGTYTVRVADRTFLLEYDDPNNLIIGDMLSQEMGCHYNFNGSGWDDFNDFLYAKYTLYLPFVGSINLDPSAIAQSTLSVRFTVNMYNGNIVYWVYTRSRDEETDTLYGTYSGCCAVEIPMMGAQETGSVLGKVTNTVTALATGAASIATGNLATAIGGAVNSAQTIIDASLPHYSIDRSGSIDVNSTTQQAYAIRLKISRPNVKRIAEEDLAIQGKPSYFICEAKDLPAGINVISDINLDTVNASNAEKERIRSIFRGGVFV